MKILCPTDFSDHSRIALDYAINLANDLNAEVHVLAVYSVPRSASSFVSLDDQIKANTQEDMDQLMKEIGPMFTSGIAPVAKVHKGGAADIIMKYAKKFELDLIVMGTQGSSNLRTIVMGSVTRKVAENSTTPVLAIPERVAHHLSNNHMVIALDGAPISDANTLAVPLALAHKLGLKIDVLHVDKGDGTTGGVIGGIDLLGDALGKTMVTKDADPVDAIKRYGEEQNVGMVMMIRRQKSFFKRLFTVGHTSEEIAQSNVPLLMLPG